MRRSLEPSLREAERVLSRMGGTPRAAFASRVRFLPLGPPLCVPPVDRGVLDTLVEGLYRGRKLTASYAPRGQEARPYTLHPLGLVSKTSTRTPKSRSWVKTTLPCARAQAMISASGARGSPTAVQ